ncbi:MULTISPECIES: hypothetical protein [unclassified Acinetobacter]|uniref:hypothetical protein n=1 Tax=unclassified Acinetobacter TaxID=196816 RepID=UPI000AEC4EFE|nr:MULTISPECIES: hypothetical protein [unclassified Acinetobacter]
MSCITELDNESLVELAADEQAFKELLKAVHLINQACFKYEKPKKKDDQPSLIHFSFW